MNYRTLPAYLFFEISQSEDIGSALEANGVTVGEWEQINEERGQYVDNAKANRVFELQKDIYYLRAKYQTIVLALRQVKVQRDEEIINHLKEYGFKIGTDHYKDAVKAERYAQSNLNKINKKIEDLEGLTKTESEDKKVSFDSQVLAYASFCEMGMIDTNKMTISQFDAMVGIGEKKLKSLEKSNVKG